MSEEWQHLQSLFHAALSLKIEERAAYLTRACVGDERLRVEVESLIAAFEKRSDLLKQPVLNLGMQVLSSGSTNELPAGSLIGSFKILTLLGNGGMGNVYLAEDIQLGRRVALKFLSGGLADDQWAKRQFIKEAQAVARLDHPNICTVHRFEETDGYSFIVMQHIEGERLDQLIQRRKFELKEVLNISVQIASALSEAHAHGIIHRDVKPPNIMVMASGQVKVLDFGLAKFVQPSQQSILTLDEPSSHSLQLGFIPGTVAYMSPEQLRGERLDYQTDIFSFGAVLYEMIDGKNPFAGNNKVETISAILTSQPAPLRNSAPHIPRELERLVQKCLEKEKSKRYQSASKILVDLEAFQKTLNSQTKLSAYLNVRAVAAAALLLLLIIVSTFVYKNLARPRTVAVLPIANETGDEQMEYMSNGMTEILISKLSGLSKLHVKAYSTVSGYKGRQLDLQKIGRDLNVDAVVTGKLTGAKGALELQTTLIDITDGSQLWGDRFKLGLEELFHVEDEVSRQVISKMELWPRTDKDKALVQHRSKNPEAREQYMRGQYHWRYRDKENIQIAIGYFNEAIRLDPTYAQAYAGLANSYVLLNTVNYGNMDPKESWMRAEWAAKQALENDDTLAEAHTALGAVKLRYYWNWEEAEREFTRAIELKPDYDLAHYWYSILLAITGRLHKSVVESEISKDLAPFSPPATLNFCRSFYFSRQYGQAATCFVKLTQDQPDYKNGWYMLGLVYLQTGRYQEALGIFEKLYNSDKALAGAALGYTYGVMARRDDALKVLSEIQALKTKAQAEKSYIASQEIAIIYIGLGDKENAFVWLKKTADEHFPSIAYIGVDPLFDSIRSDQRFAHLAAFLNLPSRPPGY